MQQMLLFSLSLSLERTHTHTQSSKAASRSSNGRRLNNGFMLSIRSKMRIPLCMNILSSPLRQCIVSKRQLPSKLMVRFVRVQEEEISSTKKKIRLIPDFESRRRGGKGVWLHPACLDYAMKYNMFARAFRDDRSIGMVIDDDLAERVRTKLRDDFFDAVKTASRENSIRLRFENEELVEETHDHELDHVQLVIKISNDETSCNEYFSRYDRPVIVHVRDSSELCNALLEELKAK